MLESRPKAFSYLRFSSPEQRKGDSERRQLAMAKAYANAHGGKSLAPTAYSKALRYYDHRKVLPRHVELAREAVLAHE